MIKTVKVGMRVRLDNPLCCHSDRESEGLEGTVLEDIEDSKEERLPGIKPDRNGSFLVLLDGQPIAYWRCRRCLSEVK